MLNSRLVSLAALNVPAIKAPASGIKSDSDSPSKKVTSAASTNGNIMQHAADSANDDDKSAAATAAATEPSKEEMEAEFREDDKGIRV